MSTLYFSLNFFSVISTTTTTILTTTTNTTSEICIYPQWITDGEYDFNGGDCCRQDCIGDDNCDHINNFDGGDCLGTIS